MSALDLTVRGRARTLVPSSARTRLKRRLQRAMQAAGCGDAEVSLALVDDDEIHALNRHYRREDKPTDVLSFSQQEGTGVAPLPPGTTFGLLGDIVISIETAARQAETGGHQLDAELLHLAVHGLVHLLGYDHATVAEERVMFGYEAELREQALSRRTVEDRPRPRLVGRKAPPRGGRAVKPKPAK